MARAQASQVGRSRSPRTRVGDPRPDHTGVAERRTEAARRAIAGAPIERHPGGDALPAPTVYLTIVKLSALEVALDPVGLFALIFSV